MSGQVMSIVVGTGGTAVSATVQRTPVAPRLTPATGVSKNGKRLIQTWSVDFGRRIYGDFQTDIGEDLVKAKGGADG